MRNNIGPRIEPWGIAKFNNVKNSDSEPFTITYWTRFFKQLLNKFSADPEFHSFPALNREYCGQPEAEFKEFVQRLKFKPRLKQGWFHLKL